MSDKPGGAGAGHGDVWGRSYTWGCGHSGSQESAHRKHFATRTHAERKCACFGHDYCDPKKCKLAGRHISGYIPSYQHTEAPADLAKRTGDAMLKLGARKTGDAFVLDTVVGALRVMPQGDWIATRFEEPARAAKVVDCNPHSGKWNFMGGSFHTDLLADFLRRVRPLVANKSGSSGGGARARAKRRPAARR